MILRLLLIATIFASACGGDDGSGESGAGGSASGTGGTGGDGGAAGAMMPGGTGGFYEDAHERGAMRSVMRGTIRRCMRTS